MKNCTPQNFFATCWCTVRMYPEDKDLTKVIGRLYWCHLTCVWLRLAQQLEMHNVIE